MIFKTLLVTVLVSLTCIICHSQQLPSDKFSPGLIVKNNGDTLRGFIFSKAQPDYYQCYFKQSKESIEISTYNPKEITMYSVGDVRLFYSANVDGAQVFLESLVVGKVSLLYAFDRFFIKTSARLDELVINEKNVNRNDRIFKMKVETYKGVLQEEMKDCSTIYQKLQSIKLEKSDLTELFIHYHKCIGNNYNEFVVTNNKLRVTIGIGAGGSISGLQYIPGYPFSIPYSSKREYINGYSVFSSLSFEFSGIGIKDKILLKTGISIYKNQHHANRKSFLDQNLDLSANFRRIAIPVEFKYYIKSRPNTPYVFGGVLLGFTLNWSDRLIIRNPPLYNTTASYSTYAQNLFFPSIVSGIGYRISGRKHSYFLELKGDLAFKVNSHVNWGSLYTIGPNAGMMF